MRAAGPAARAAFTFTQAFATPIDSLILELGQFLDRIAEADNSILITAYEKKIRQLEEEKITLDEKIAQCGRPLQSFDETFRTAFSFLSNPYQLWVSDRLEHKKAVMKLAFSERLRYCRNEGFRIPEKSLPFLLLEGSNGERYKMVV